MSVDTILVVHLLGLVFRTARRVDQAIEFQKLPNPQSSKTRQGPASQFTADFNI